MRKLHKAAVVVATLSSIGILGAGTAHADGGNLNVGQASQCRSHDLNVNVLGEVGLVNGLLGSALNGEGSPGAQQTHQGSDMGCNNAVSGGEDK
ncbi:hypothetical protein FCH28_33535 [Streptomyces piniterrae]|uniref:Secreted protein n=1 Tax=Streptomyces piniterrae TaxID=2571125 RepID=A0A4U0MPR1_9ACTN|nr:hypothetical protein [Streptomyces piniterrae]TJZ42817.1 hypothetical protein FCH28_33535 [Streptomyces piniterrae]